MKKLFNTLFYLTLLLIISGIILKYFTIVGGATSLTLGLIGVCIYYLAKSVKEFINKIEKLYFRLFLNFVLILTSILLFVKYLHHSFFDYFSIIVAFVFIVAFFSMITLRLKVKPLFDKIAPINTTVVMILYFLLLIPTFFESENGPNMIVHPSIVDKYYDVTSIGTNIPTYFKYKETKLINDSASILLKNNSIDLAMNLFKRKQPVKYIL
jgi:hypothetical protein